MIKLLKYNNLNRLKRIHITTGNSKWVFITLLIVVSLLYHYHEILFFRPQAVHQWRQSDCLSITMNFYQEGMDFFNPSIHNQAAEGGKSGHTVSEFPIIYYFVAFLWTIFGHHEFIFRLVNLLIIFVGLFALFKFIEDVLKDSIWAILVTLLLFTSPMLVYYSNNFLANVPAFGFALMGWYFFWKFYKNENLTKLYTSMFFFLIAGLLKITSAMSFVAITIIFLMELLHIYQFKNKLRIFKNPGKQIVPFLIVIVCLVSWYLYARNYNQKHSASFFLIGILPIWKIDYDTIDSIWMSVREIWSRQYFSLSVQALSALIFLFQLVFFRKVNKLFLAITILLFIGFSLYVVLWFEVFSHHDYYLINLLIFYVFIILTFLYFLKENARKLFKSMILKIIFIVFVIYNIFYCSHNIKMRYCDAFDYKPMHKKIFTNSIEHGFWIAVNDYYIDNIKSFENIKPYLRSLGIKREDKVISFNDGSFNITLYLMDQKGWGSFGNNFTDSSGIATKINLGAKYLIAFDTAIYNKEYIQPFIKKKIGSYNNIDIFDLQ